MITIIGLGEVGEATLREIAKKRNDVFGVDIDEEKIKRLKFEGFNVSLEIKKSNVYIISVYSTEDVLNTVYKLDYSNKPLVTIESTIALGTVKKIIEFKEKSNINFNLVLFPHRYNAADPEHHVFNLDRVLGGLTKECTKRALEFYSQFMDKRLIHIFPIEVVELCKPLENAYRFMEIAIAEELKMLCDEKDIDFNQVREAMNTKWNVNVKEAREGIKGKCLLKDTLIINDFFNDNQFLNNVIKIDEGYKEKLKR